MRHIPPLRTDRINAQLRELTVGEAIHLANAPETQEEAGRTQLLKYIIVSSTGLIADPDDWTVEERLYALAHYLSAVDEEPNFRIHGGGVLTDYLYLDDPSAPDEIDLAEFGAPGLRLTQMTGSQSELVQTLASCALDWTLADMAVRLVRQGEQRPCHKKSPADFTQWLATTMKALRSMPASDFESLFVVYMAGRQRLAHIWRIAFDARGHVCLPRQRQQPPIEAADEAKSVDGVPEIVKKEVGLPPARFSVSACPGLITRSLAGLVA